MRKLTVLAFMFTLALTACDSGDSTTYTSGAGLPYKEPDVLVPVPAPQPDNLSWVLSMTARGVQVTDVLVDLADQLKEHGPVERNRLLDALDGGLSIQCEPRCTIAWR